MAAFGLCKQAPACVWVFMAAQIATEKSHDSCGIGIVLCPSEDMYYLLAFERARGWNNPKVVPCAQCSVEGDWGWSAESSPRLIWGVFVRPSPRP